MTVVVGFVGPGGAIMASDTEETESEHTRMDVEKISAVGGLLLGYSGPGSVKQPLEVRIASQVGTVFGDATEIDRWEARSALRAAAAPVLKEAYDNFVSPDPRMHAGHVLAGALLVVGRDSNGYWLFEIDAHNQGTFYEGAGFHTVGSGSSAAYVSQALMKGYDPAGRSLSHLKLIAYRTVETCINTLGGGLGVGGRVDLWASEEGGPFERAPEDDLARMSEGVEKWTTIERESLDEVVLFPAGAEGSPAGAELPEELEVSRTEPAQSEGESP